MSSQNSDEFRHLISRLSDGTFTDQDMQRLNEFLQDNPESQEMFLGHMMIDALLEREFEASQVEGIFSPESDLPQLGLQKVSHLGGEADTKADSAHSKNMLSRIKTVGRQRFSWIAASLLLLIVGLTASWCLPIRDSATLEPSPVALRLVPLILSNAGFESNDPQSPNGISSGRWLGDLSEHVEQFAGLAPLEGRRMLRFVKSSTEPMNVCEVYQLVDVRPFLAFTTGRETLVEASAFFNSLGEDQQIESDEFAFGVTVYAFSEFPSHAPNTSPATWQRSLGASGNKILADTDAKSWQQVDTRLPLPADTHFLIVKLSVIRTKPDPVHEFPGQFVDNVALNLVCLQ